MDVHNESEALPPVTDDIEIPTQTDFYIDLPPLKIKPPPNVISWNTESSDSSAFVSAQQISTYPLLPDKSSRDGDPIADKYFFNMTQNRCIFAIADGCNWGARSMNAARSAIEAFRGYFVEPRGDKLPRHLKITELRGAGHMLLRSFDASHKKILASTREDIWEAGTTTLIGCLLLELDVDDNKGNFGFLCASVGDCKAFVYHRKADTVIDITAGNRLHVKDKRDPGGRLGPYAPGGAPDLRNLSLYFVRCYPGDLIIAMSDGVHDNLDPEQLGLKLDPNQLGFNPLLYGPNIQRSLLDIKDWSLLGRQESEDVKKLFREYFILNLIKKGKDSPKELTEGLIRHCEETTKSSRDFMENNPNTAQPSDYVKYPGKMDHTTCITFCVPSANE